MTDITKCANPEGCPVRDKCYRATSPTEERQSWAVFTPEKGAECEGYYKRG